MKIIITEEQQFTLRSLNGVKKYVEDEIQFAMNMYFPRDGEELISVMWDLYFEYV
jgi:hypothetical protein